MKIVNIMTSNSKKYPFGTEKAGYAYTNALLDAGHEVLFIYSNDYDLDYITKSQNLKTWKLKSKNILNIIKERIIINKFNPDAVIVHQFFKHHKFAIAKRFLSTMIAHCIIGGKQDRYFAKNKLKKLNYDKIICFTQKLKAEINIYGQIPIEKIDVIPNIIYEIKSKKPNNTTLTIGAIGSLVHAKNNMLLLKSLEILKQKEIPFNCIIAGEGDEKEMLQNYINDNDLNDSVKMIGYIKDIKTDFFDKIDIFVSLSRFETFGLTAIEAFSASKPTILSNITSFIEFSENDKNALIADINNLDDIVTKFEKMLIDENYRDSLSENAYKYYKNNYTNDIVIKKIESIITK